MGKCKRLLRQPQTSDLRSLVRQGAAGGQMAKRIDLTVLLPRKQRAISRLLLDVNTFKIICITATLLCAAPARAGGEQVLESVVVVGNRSTNLVGVADSASVGTVTRQQLKARTVYRPGELLEATPGLIVSQHSGEGKANQFYLRGFNLDHGTDLRTTVDGMLVNQRSHAHGQGWTDLNFMIPELATGLEYKKGPYFASEGDFSSAGAVSIRYVNTLAQGIASVGFGQNGFRRVLLADSPKVGSGHLLYALEAMHNDGPFTQPEDFGKFNGVLRYSQGDAANGFQRNAKGLLQKSKRCRCTKIE
jgi:hypothetical protein